MHDRVQDLGRFTLRSRGFDRRLGHDNHHRLFQVYGWEEKKTKTSWGGTSVDHDGLAEVRVRAMTVADLNWFVVMCSLIPDLYCPGYSSAETLSKEANLMRAAVRYKVDASKIAARVTAELSTKGKGGMSTVLPVPSVSLDLIDRNKCRHELLRAVWRAAVNAVVPRWIPGRLSGPPVTATDRGRSSLSQDPAWNRIGSR